MKVLRVFQIFLKSKRNFCEYLYSYIFYCNFFLFFYFQLDYDNQNTVTANYGAFSVTLFIFSILLDLICLRLVTVKRYTYLIIEFFEIGNTIFAVCGIILKLIGYAVEKNKYRLFERLINKIHKTDIRVS